jgi:hypothetical protein
VPGAGLTAIVIKPGAEVVEFQAKLIDAIMPFTEGVGTADAYVRTDAEPDINQDTIDYIDALRP